MWSYVFYFLSLANKYNQTWTSKTLCLVVLSPLAFLFKDPGISNSRFLHLNNESVEIPFVAESPKIKTIKVMTYNIRHGRDLKLKNNLDRVVQVIKDQQADVISLQEVDANRIRTNYQDQAKYIASKLNYNYYFAKAIDIKSGGQYGNAILSRFPMDDIQIIRLPKGDARKPGRRELRVAVSALIIPDQNDQSKNFIFISTHLGIFDNKTKNPNRGVTAQRLLEFVNKPKYAKQFTVLAGDLNVAHSKLVSLSQYDFKKGSVISNLNVDFTVEPYDILKSNQIDYILYRNHENLVHIESWNVIDEPGDKTQWISDHLARTSTFSYLEPIDEVSKVNTP